MLLGDFFFSVATNVVTFILTSILDLPFLFIRNVLGL